MKVNERKGVVDPRVGAPTGVAPDGSQPAPTAPAAGDQVSVSDAARELARLKSEVGDLDGVREDQVAVLQAVTEGGGQVASPRQTAQKLLREVLGELLA